MFFLFSLCVFFFFFSSRRRHTRCREVSWARRCVQETGINAEYMGIMKMEKQKADVIFKMNLAFDRKFSITQTSFKKYMEDHIAGLKIKSFPTFLNNEGQYIIEIVSNIDQVLVLNLDNQKVLPPGKIDNIEICEKLLTNLKILGTQFKMQKIKSDAILKLYNSILAQAEEASEQAKQPKSLPKQTSFSDDTEVDTLRKIVQNLNNELKALEKENLELKQKLSDEKDSEQYGDDILLKQIKILEEKVAKSEEMYEDITKETEEKNKNLTIRNY
eukprot:TRINITY_DN25966_c0_g1_i1.p1 TRINITY_DN25966_c0_g1~~TRINITY_DN25966_c0_g1_i1.p1  ORF type:complete len:273 (+),score=93.76 TRINITY_DN25966_c0_g1_i1:27-845(+)